jgi:hypothetical protein
VTTAAETIKSGKSSDISGKISKVGYLPRVEQQRFSSLTSFEAPKILVSKSKINIPVIKNAVK